MKTKTNRTFDINCHVEYCLGATFLLFLLSTGLVEAQTTTMQADSYSLNALPVSFRFLSLPGTTCFSASCGTVSPACDSTTRSPNYTVDTTYTPCETENITAVVTADPANGANQTKTVFLTERYHIGCNFTRGLGVITFDPVTGNPAAAFVTVMVIPLEAGTVSRASGTSVRNPLTGEYEFFSTYTANPSYSGRVRVKFATTGNTLVVSFDQNTEITNFSSTWRTINDRFSVDQYNDNSYQLYRIYLYANQEYDFSLAAADGVGGSCSGDGDLRMYNSSGSILWYIDGDSARGFDASTLGTQYERWSPPSTGYYFLKVSEYSGNSMIYTLAYRELSTSCVDDAYEQDDTAGAAKAISCGTTQNRTICPGDEDWAVFTLSGPNDVVLATGPRSGYTGGDTELWLYGPNSSTTQIAYNDDYSGLWSQIGVAGLATGTYYVRVRELGNNAAIPGYTLSLTCTGVCTDDAYEQDDTAGTAKTIADNETQNRTICPGDEDWAIFTVSTASSAVVVRTDARSGYAGGDTEMWLFGPNSSATQIGYNDDFSGLWSQITVSNLATGTYYVRVRDLGNNDPIPGYTLYLDIMPPPPLVITNQPVSRTNELGTTAMFTVAADGAGPLRYQWRLNNSDLSNGGRISGATNATLTIQEVRLQDAGDYTVLVSNAAESVTNLPARLTVGMAKDRLTILSSTAGVSCLEVSGPAGRVFRLQGSPDLFHWALLGRYTNQDGTLVITSTPTAGWNAYFFRTFVPSNDSPTNGVGPTLGPIQLFPDGSVRLQLTSTPGTAWRLQGAPDLRHWGDYGLVTNSGNSVWITNTPLGKQPRYFYRAAQP